VTIKGKESLEVEEREKRAQRAKIVGGGEK
jgi:hypothetical protein